jgi:putative oxidoreductase
MQLFRPATVRELDVSLCVVRVVSGLTVAAHGYQKVMVMGVSGVTGMLTKMGVPMPSLAGPFIAYLELIGGLLLVAGLFTRPIALLLALDMLGAASLVHLRNGFFLPGGAEFVLLLMSAFVASAIAGGGVLSVDAALAKGERPAR